MSTYVKFAAEAGDQYLAALAEGQETFLKSVAAYSKSTPAPAQMQAFAQSLPTPQELTEASFAFTSKLLKQQKEFTEKLFAVGVPPAAAPSKGSAKN